MVPPSVPIIKSTVALASTGTPNHGQVPLFRGHGDSAGAADADDVVGIDHILLWSTFTATSVFAREADVRAGSLAANGRLERYGGAKSAIAWI